ncbi:MAG TPA: DNA translocase FtsK [Candidatus Onthomorpha intestinigallinarum]|uniref:DNA translocase FtsK n=1 Tax=Candidatus Onthomorpha intestinigallinarum TaxID=2840880 RepID=A0A9D1RHJ1_9BACT|nr:DNA translocase FtsK [Candidatus Onthomorpha intestinigallinarum]
MEETKGTKKSKRNGKKDSGFLTKAMRSERMPKILAVVLGVFAVFCFVSFVSFFGTWFDDYDKVQGLTPLKLLKGEQNIENWGGPLGAFLSCLVIRNTFGIASFGFLILLFLYILRLFKVPVRQRAKWIMSTLVIMLWLSVLIGYFVIVLGFKRLDIFAGTVGVAINYWLVGVIGRVGATLFSLAFTICFPMFLFNVRYLFLKKWIIDFLDSLEKRRERKELLKKERKQRAEAEKNISTPMLDEMEDKEADDELTEEEKEELNRFVFVNGNDRDDKTLSDDIDFTIEDTIHQKDGIADEEEEEICEDDRIHFGIDQPYDPKLDLPSFILPDTDLLTDYEKNNKLIEEKELLSNKDRIVDTLKNYNIDIIKIAATPGPTVTLYEIVPAPGTRISKIKNLEDDIALSLSALGIRIIAPIPGKGTIGIEVPNSNPQIVSMKTMLNSPQFLNNKYELPIAIGKTISSEPFVTDLTKMPHLLMAGATGQGKSVGLNAIIASLLFKKHPTELKFVMVDPKKVELSLYAKIERHYLAKLPDSEEAIITDVKKVVRTLNSLCIEMDQRYDLLKAAGCKKITEYNAKFCARKLLPTEGHHYLPYIVLVIDGFADLIMTAGKEIEMPIARLAQLARAVGIHLLIATQRPTVNIITGTIKANFPARIAFKVSSKTDSRTILDTGGAEQLIGRGDMLISLGSDLIRLQCALIDTEEIEKLADFIGSQRGFEETFLLPEYLDETSEPSKEVDMKQLDDKFEEAARLVVLHQHGSTSLIQRKLALGYNRAGKIIDQLETAGIVGPFEGSKAREVLVKTEAELNEILKEYSNK